MSISSDGNEMGGTCTRAVTSTEVDSVSSDDREVMDTVSHNRED